MGFLYKITVVALLVPVLIPAFLANALLAWPCSSSPLKYAYNMTFRSIRYLWDLWDAEAALQGLDDPS